MRHDSSGKAQPSLQHLIRASVLSLVAVSTGAIGATEEMTQVSEADFQSCISELKTRAQAEGISPDTAGEVLDQIAFQDRVIELDRSQPEFTTTFADYFSRRVNEQRIEQGRELLKQHEELLNRVTRETGVPPAYLVAFWGLETNFGSYFGKMSVPESLATLACDGRRGTYFSGELMSALKIIDEGAITADRMEGSWAGAMGHVQFMPSVFLRYAVDADGDGRRDLWNSIPDAMMSAGNFLSSIGWNGEYRWGREVLLPDGFDYSQSGLDHEKPLSAWREAGITDAFGKPLANADVSASLLVPAGHEGPAFLVYHNFHVIMGWNRSQYYALSVGQLADRIAGGGDLQNPPPTDAPRLSRDNVKTLQDTLTAKGYQTGKADGILGPTTRRAIRAYQRDQAMIADGYPDPELFTALDITIAEPDET